MTIIVAFEEEHGSIYYYTKIGICMHFQKTKSGSWIISVS
jgi:hypothetical protein